MTDFEMRLNIITDATSLTEMNPCIWLLIIEHLIRFLRQIAFTNWALDCVLPEVSP